MNRFSTQLDQQVNTIKDLSIAQPRPKTSTIAFIKQFARAYMPIPKMPGLVLN